MGPHTVIVSRVTRPLHEPKNEWMDTQVRLPGTMGIKGLLAGLRRDKVAYRRWIALSDLKGHMIAVDFLWFALHRRATSFEDLHMLFGEMERQGVGLILVFDGCSHPDKFRWSGRSCDGLTEDARLIIDLFRSRGYVCLQSLSDAETLCCSLQREGVVDWVLSGDTDCLAHGCTRLLMNLSRSKGGKISAMVVSLETILDHLGLTMDQFKEFCVLLGCDLNGGVRGVGYVKARSLFAAHGGIPADLLRTPSLNHDICMRLFAPVPARDLIL